MPQLFSQIQGMAAPPGPRWIFDIPGETFHPTPSIDMNGAFYLTAQSAQLINDDGVIVGYGSYKPAGSQVWTTQAYLLYQN